MFKKPVIVDVTARLAPASPHADLEGQVNGAGATAAFAVSTFIDAASDLVHAANEQEIAASIAQERIDDLFEIRDAALAQAESNREVARKLQALVGEPVAADPLAEWERELLSEATA